MRLTNKFGLPDPIIKAIENDPYNPGDCDISTTRLIDSPQVVTLSLRYAGSLSEDVSERIWSLLGQCIHVLLERAAPNAAISEKRYFANVDGWRISGAIDLIDSKTLVDYKMTSVWTYLYKSRISDWTAQANVNRWLYTQNGGHISEAVNVLFLRDWAHSKAISGSDYPPVQVVTVPLELWTLEKTEVYIRERIKLHKAARSLPTEILPECSDQERWMRKGHPIRCQTYCPVREFCFQNKGKKKTE